VKNAKHLVDAYEQAEKEGIGAIEIAGMMVDVPVADRARALLRRNSTISLKERHK
jgi:citrate lyase beta subunit